MEIDNVKLEVRTVRGEARYHATIFSGGTYSLAAGIGDTPQEATLRAALQWAGVRATGSEGKAEDPGDTWLRFSKRDALTLGFRRP